MMNTAALICLARKQEMQHCKLLVCEFDALAGTCHAALENIRFQIGETKYLLLTCTQRSGGALSDGA